MIFAILLFLITLIFGYAIARKLASTELLPLALLIGVVGFGWIQFGLSMLGGFNSITISITAALLIISSYVLLDRKAKPGEISNLLINFDSFLVFFVSLLVTGYAVYVSLDFSNGFSASTQDYPFHLGVISTIATGNFPPHYPYYAQQPLSYYYFAHLLIAALGNAGMGTLLAFESFISIITAAAITELYIIARKLLNSKLFAIVAIILMFVVAPCTGCQDSGAAWFSPFSPPSFSKLMNSGSKGFPFSPVLLAFPYSQIGMTIGFLAFASIARLLMEEKRKNKLLAIGVVIGLTPMFNFFFYLIFLAILGLFLLQYRTRDSAYGFGAATILALPQALLLLTDKFGTSAEGFIHLELFAGAQNLWDLAMFWLLNIGGHVILALLGALMVKKLRRTELLLVTAGTAMLFAFGNIFALTPYAWDANKLFLPFLMLLGIFAAGFVQWLWNKNILGKAAFAIIAALAIASSYYQFFLFFQNSLPHTPIVVADKAHLEACEWLKTNTPNDAIFVTGERLEQGGCVYAVAGRRTYESVPFWIQSHGFDEEAAHHNQELMLSGDVSLMKESGVNYVFADKELEKQISSKLKANLNSIYSKDDIGIYKLN